MLGPQNAAGAAIKPSPPLMAHDVASATRKQWVRVEEASRRRGRRGDYPRPTLWMSLLKGYIMCIFVPFWFLRFLDFARS